MRQSMFDRFPQSEIDVVAPDGSVRCATKAVMGSEKIVIPDPSVIVLVGDEIRRRLPNGTEEAFDVLDPVFYDGGQRSRIPSHFAVKVRKKGTFPRGKGGNYTFNVSGANARVNFHSTDYSQNFAASNAVFDNLRSAILSGVSDPSIQHRLREAVDDMESRSGDSEGFVKSYQNFVSLAADHMTVIAPFLPALSQLLG